MWGCTRGETSLISRANRSAPHRYTGAEHLHRNEAVVPEIARQADDRHAAVAELADENEGAGGEELREPVRTRVYRSPAPAPKPSTTSRPRR